MKSGLFGTFRNTTAHAPKIHWPINEQDARLEEWNPRKQVMDDVVLHPH